MVIDVLVQPVRPIFKGLDRLITEDGTDRLCRATVPDIPTCATAAQCHPVSTSIASFMADVSETQR